VTRTLPLAPLRRGLPAQDLHAELAQLCGVA
jgi:hypothetical protein